MLSQKQCPEKRFGQVWKGFEGVWKGFGGVWKGFGGVWRKLEEFEQVELRMEWNRVNLNLVPCTCSKNIYQVPIDTP